MLTLSLDWQVFNCSSDGSNNLKNGLAWCISSYQQCCLGGALPVIPATHPLVHFTGQSGSVEMVIWNETEMEKVLWLSVGIGARVSPTQPLSLHVWWMHCVTNTSSLELFLMSSLHAAVDVASADLGERKI